jgi:hypothetical protein
VHFPQIQVFHKWIPEFSLNLPNATAVVCGMRPLLLTVLVVVGTGLANNPLHAGDTFFGQEGSGRPTNTLVGALFGAATGAAIGQATGGEDGWWIGSLVGTAVGGSLGNTIPTEGYHYQGQSQGYRPRHVESRRVVSYRPSHYRSYSSRSYCPPVYRSRPIVREVVIEQPVVVEQPVIVSAPELAPYGFLGNDGKIKSPWSDFSMSVGGLSPGQTVYDGLSGKAFRVP